MEYVGDVGEYNAPLLVSEYSALWLVCWLWPSDKVDGVELLRVSNSLPDWLRGVLVLDLGVLAAL